MKDSRLYPIKFIPILKERLWGGSKLKTVLGKPIKSGQTGESWELSGIAGDVSLVANGPLKGKSLQELIDMYSTDLLGKSVVERFGSEFPILIKFIDAQKDLSIQLHPGDELAMKRHQSFGKTEMWYIMDAEKGAELIIGFNKDVDAEEYQQFLEQGKLTDLMNYVPVNKGDTFFINTGKVHAIGAGIMLTEIQQTSDITYRIYDFERRDKEGNLRELHTEQALEAIDYRKKEDYRVEYQKETNQLNSMVASPYFTTNYLKCTNDTKIDLSERDSFTILICVDGEAEIKTAGGKEPLKMGETILIPAIEPAVLIRTQSATLLEVTV